MGRAWATGGGGGGGGAILVKSRDNNYYYNIIANHCTNFNLDPIYTMLHCDNCIIIRLSFTSKVLSLGDT